MTLISRSTVSNSGSLVYIPASTALRQNNPPAKSFSPLQLTSLFRQLLFGGNYLEVDPATALGAEAIPKDELSFYGVANFGPIRAAIIRLESSTLQCLFEPLSTSSFSCCAVMTPVTEV